MYSGTVNMSLQPVEVSRYGTQVSIQHVDISRYFYKSLQHVDVSRYYGQCSTEQHVDVFRYCTVNKSLQQICGFGTARSPALLAGAGAELSEFWLLYSL